MTDHDREICRVTFDGGTTLSFFRRGGFYAVERRDASGTTMLGYDSSDRKAWAIYCRVGKAMLALGYVPGIAAK